MRHAGAVLCSTEALRWRIGEKSEAGGEKKQLYVRLFNDLNMASYGIHLMY